MIKPDRQIFKVCEIVPAGYNPRKITPKQRAGLEKSLDKFGYLQDIIINIRDNRNRIVGGHRRLEGLGLAQGEEIECTVVDLSDIEEKALNVALNNRHTAGEYDQEGLEKILAELKTDYDNFDDLNFDDLVDEFGIGDNLEFIEGNFDKSKNPNDVYGAGSFPLRVNDIICYVQDEDSFKRLEEISKKLEKVFNEDEKGMQEYKNTIGLKIIKLILENENSIFQ